jgi:hypothetical protein
MKKLPGPGDGANVRQMPPGRQLPQEQIDAIRLWITNGALQN